jgi:anti-anti-sigma factor
MNNPTQPSLEVEMTAGSSEGETILKVRGPLLISNFFEFQEAARDVKARVLIIDLEAVPYMDSAALGAIVGIHVASANRKMKYALINVAERINTMFTVSGVQNTLVIYPTLAEAEAALV